MEREVLQCTLHLRLLVFFLVVNCLEPGFVYLWKFDKLGFRCIVTSPVLLAAIYVGCGLFHIRLSCGSYGSDIPGSPFV